MTHSVERRFIAIVSIVFLSVVTPLIAVLMSISYNDAVDRQSNHLDLLMASNVQALSGPLAAQDHEIVNHLSGLLISDPSILKVQVRNTSGELTIVQTRGQFDESIEGIERSADITFPSQYGDVAIGTLTIYPKPISFFSEVTRTERGIIATFALAITSVFATAIFGNRMMIIKPLMKLTAAIEDTGRLGTRQRVDWSSKDELGRLATSFNAMQSALEQQERAKLQAHQRTSDIYQHTPAMLFSLDAYDRISAVSDYWVEAAGYKRADVIGKKFAELIHLDDNGAFVQRKKHSSVDPSSNDLLDLTLRFICADGSTMDVLILEKELLNQNNETALEALSVMTDVTELRQSELRNRQQAITDHLTGLYNRQGFEAALDARIAQADADGLELACLFIDLDRFKVINDNLGHAAGDIVLRAFVERLRPLLGPQDCASRFGGDEFAILLIGNQIAARASDLCASIAQMADKPIEIQDNIIRLSSSIGVAHYPQHASSAAELMLNADMAMYVRKRQGRNGAQVFCPSIMDNVRERAEIDSDIDLALENNWFEAHLQPIQDLSTGTISGFEALMRINHPQKGLLAPAPVIAVAQENGTIGKIGDRVLEAAIANLAQLSTVPELANTYVAVNFSALQFEAGLSTRIAGLLNRYNIAASRLVIEITEAILMSDDAQIRNILKVLQNFGCRIALDDFGTGYSSLSYLTRFPVNIIKIDRSFTSSLLEGDPEVCERSRMLVEGICAISHHMNCHVIAEGIESREQAEILTAMGVDFGQGYYYAKPLSIDSLMDRFEDKPIASTG
jgi:diguanylate cyclase (GGDEF)-like protein/PAS domain S-box-containing protein